MLVGNSVLRVFFSRLSLKILLKSAVKLAIVRFADDGISTHLVKIKTSVRYRDIGYPLHKSYLKGRSPVCVNTCRFKWDFLLNLFSQ